MPRKNFQCGIFIITSEEKTCFYFDREFSGLPDVADLLSKVRTGEDGKPLAQEAFRDRCSRQMDTDEYDSMMDRLLSGFAFATVYDIDYDQNAFCRSCWERGALRVWTSKLDKVVSAYTEALADTETSASKKMIQKAVCAVLKAGVVNITTTTSLGGSSRDRRNRMDGPKEIYERLAGGSVKKRPASRMEIEHCRAEMHRLVDDKFNDLLLSLAGVEPTQEAGDGEGRLLPLAASPAMFKGTKPETVILPDRTEVAVRTWKDAATAILADCCADPQRKAGLLYLRGRVSGNFRYLASDRPDGMSAPMKICEDLYVEGKFDTEALLKNITGKLLDQVGYDYHGIVIRCRDPQQAAVMQETETPPDEPEQDHGPEMAM